MRRIDDPIAGSRATIDEYCAGDRIVTINGPRVAIADYAAQQLTEIDHAAGTYSITSFAEIAKARPATRETRAKVSVEVNRSVALSREAVEALIGASYPNRHLEQHDQILNAAAPASGRIVAQSVGGDAAYGLPSNTSVTYENGLTMRNVIVRVDHDLAPPRMMLIDPGAKRVESRLTRTSRELKQLDAPPKP